MVVIFREGGRNCIVKNEKCIIFPESRHANWNPAMSNINNRKIFLGNSSKNIPSKKTVEKKSKKLIMYPWLCISFHENV